MMQLTEEQKAALIAEVHYNLEHCFCSEKTSQLMQIALASLKAEPEYNVNDEFGEVYLGVSKEIYDACNPNDRWISYPASLTAEPVEYRVLREDGGIAGHFATLEDAQATVKNWNENWKIQPLYTAPQPVKMPNRIANINLRSPLEVEDMWRDKLKSAVRSAGYSVEGE